MPEEETLCHSSSTTKSLQPQESKEAVQGEGEGGFECLGAGSDWSIPLQGCLAKRRGLGRILGRDWLTDTRQEGGY